MEKTQRTKKSDETLGVDNEAQLSFRIGGGYQYFYSNHKLGGNHPKPFLNKPH